MQFHIFVFPLKSVILFSFTIDLNQRTCNFHQVECSMSGCVRRIQHSLRLWANHIPNHQMKNIIL